MKVHIMVRYTVPDLDKWLEVFESMEDLRAEKGGKEWRVFRNADKPDEVVTLLDWTDFEQARAYVKMPEMVEVRGGQVQPARRSSRFLMMLRSIGQEAREEKEEYLQLRLRE